MKICLISVEIFAWGKYGGFGRSTRMIGRELVKRGIDVTAVVPRRAGQKPVEAFDGIRVLGFDPRQPFSALELFRQADADIYHSQEPSFGTYLAQQAMPERKHIVTFRDTRNLHDWWLFLTHPTFSNIQVLLNYLYEDNFLVAQSVRDADRCFTASRFLVSKARKKYRLPQDPEFLPSSIPLPDAVVKSDTPLVCFVGRLDRIKRPHIFFELAQQFPEVDFVTIGAGHNVILEERFQKRYGRLPNLKLHGFVDQFRSKELSEILARSWILVNTSLHESLPTSFIEAVGHECAILSEINPDGFASEYGYHVLNGDYAAGLRYLLANDEWRKRGMLGAEYVLNTFSINVALQRHIKIYEDLTKIA
ncbi:MAG: glycosyltransferase [Anaerolineaceae bacterium]|nr:MAG: glycosyltransferase [Anaerolineaceae bacterium]